jgi:4-amino-4-deoxy-L-arabinose transferase-like glycosyltransferase
VKNNQQWTLDNGLQGHYLLWVALFIVGGLALLNNVVNPLFEPPDELEHYHYVRYLVKQKQLPVQSLDAEPSQAHQPPLYYLIGALLVTGIDDPEEVPPRNPFWAYYAAGEVSRDNKQQFLNPPWQAFPYSGTPLVIHLLRSWSTVLALGTVVAVWLLAGSLWPERPLQVAAMVAVAVFNPMFLYLSGAVNNDNLAIFLGAWLTWLLVRAIQTGFGWPITLLLGFVWAAAILTKLTGLFLLAPCAVALGWSAWRQHDFRFLLSRVAVMAGLALLLSGWWFARNLMVYGELLALERVLTVWGQRDTLDAVHLVNDLKYSWTNFWGRFGYGQVPMPTVVYGFYLLLSVMGLLGAGRRFLDISPREWLSSERGAIWLVLAVTSLVYVMALFYYIIRNPTGANGRYIFPALPAISALLVAGVTAWLAKPRYRKMLHTAICTGMVFISFTIAALFLPWTYSRPKLLTESQAVARLEKSHVLYWSDGIVLLGSAIASSEVHPGQPVTVTMCWRADQSPQADYVLTLRLLTPTWQVLGQRNTYTGLGTFPTSYWQVGDIFCEDYSIPVTVPLDDALVADVVVSFYDLAAQQLLPVGTVAGATLEYAPLGRVKLLPQRNTLPEMQVATDFRFAQGVSLAGYTWSSALVYGGEVVRLQLLWRASGPLDDSYTVFVHWLDAEGQLLAQADGLPRSGFNPTNYWRSGEYILDERELLLPTDAALGLTTVLVGLYVLENGGRLPVIGGDQLLDAVRLPAPIVSIR